MVKNLPALRKHKQGLCINLEGWDGVGNGREDQKGGDMCIPMADSCWDFDRKQQNSVKQLYFSLKKRKLSGVKPGRGRPVLFGGDLKKDLKAGKHKVWGGGWEGPSCPHGQILGKEALVWSGVWGTVPACFGGLFKVSQCYTRKMDYSSGRLEAKRSVRNLGQLYKGKIKALEKNIERRKWGKSWLWKKKWQLDLALSAQRGQNQRGILTLLTRGLVTAWAGPSVARRLQITDFLRPSLTGFFLGGNSCRWTPCQGHSPSGLPPPEPNLQSGSGS